VLARLDEIRGVERSFVNHAGTLLRLKVSSNADPDAVGAEVARVLAEEAGDRAAVQLPRPEAEQMVASEEWYDRDSVAQLSRSEFRARALPPMLALGVGAGLLCLGLWWWHRRRKRAK
jgi:hypothetical protein